MPSDIAVIHFPHIAVQLALLIQLPYLLGLGKEGRGCLPLNGNGNILLVLGTDERNLHGGGKGKLLLVHYLLQIRDKLGQADIPLHLFLVHAVAIPDDLCESFSGISVMLRMIQGILTNSANSLARWRRCPAMSSYPPPSWGRTSAG